jgi:two-component system NarL family response regulator
MSRRLRILIADDHGVVRGGLASLIDQQDDLVTVGQARNGREAVEMHASLRPDVTLMDLQMPLVDGVEAISQIRARDPDARIVVLTTYDGDEDIYRALRAGAMAYVLKDAEAEELFRTTRAVYAGKTCIPPAVASKLAERMRGVHLTPRELDVLRLLVVGKSNSAIAETLFVAESTVKTHINSILAKLGAEDRTEAAAIALRRGIVHLGFTTPPPAPPLL